MKTSNSITDRQAQLDRVIKRLSKTEPRPVLCTKTWAKKIWYQAASPSDFGVLHVNLHQP